MASIANQKFDLIDRKIISELDKNARISYSTLGKIIRVAKETVKYRIHQLEKLRVIKGYYTVINFSKLNYNIYRLYIRLQNTSPEIEQKIDDYLIKSSNVAVFYKINGPFHIALGVWARDNWQYEQFWNEFKEHFGQHISDSRLSLFTEYLEFSREYIMSDRSTKQSEKLIFTTVTNTSSEQINNTDLKLLSFVSNNARASLVEIAKAIETSIITVRYRLKNLIDKKIIVGFRTIFDLQNLGKEYFKVDIQLRKFDRKKEIRQTIISDANVIYTESAIGGSDFEFDVEIENFEKFIVFMNSFKEKFPEDIKDYKYYSLVKILKVNYIPTIKN